MEKGRKHKTPTQTNKKTQLSPQIFLKLFVFSLSLSGIKALAAGRTKDFYAFYTRRAHDAVLIVYQR